MTTIEIAQAFAHSAHDSISQKRKYTGAPYWVHTDEVASIVTTVTNDEDTIVAAHCHDILEDVFPVNSYYSLDLIRKLFGERAAGFVFDLTDQYVKENYPQWNRKLRKQKERERMGLTASESQTVKLADLISNSKDILVNDRNFAVTYLREKQALLPHLMLGDVRLWVKAAEIANDGCRELGIETEL